MSAAAAALPAHLEDLLANGLRAQHGGQFERAAELYSELLRLAPNNFDGLQLLGVVRAEQGALDEAIRLLSRAVGLNPRAVAVLNNLGNALRDAGRFREAVDVFASALRIEANSVVALANLAITLTAVGELRFAGRCVDRALGIQPDHPAVLYALGFLMGAAGQHRAAIEAFERAIAGGYSSRAALVPLGLAYESVGEPAKAWETFGRAEQEEARFTTRLYRAYAGLQCARWERFEEDTAAFPATPNRESLDPQRLLHFPLSGAELRRQIVRFSGSYAARGVSLEPPRAPLVPALRRERIRLAYLSPDFRGHPVGLLLAGMLPAHDRSTFEVYGYAWGPPADPSGTRARVAAACDRFQEVGELTDQALIARLRADEIDVAVDLAGYTANHRLGIFAARVAPVQVNWLGFPGTSGPILDYICADRYIIPPGSEGEFCEQVVRLPHTYLPYSRAYGVASPPARQTLGLPETATVLACFGQLRKINSRVFDLWSEVLREVPDAVLWLATSNEDGIRGLRHEAQRRGVAPERIVFAPWAGSHADHLARYRIADLALDTFPYGSHTTAADALWAGCPLVALAGDSFVSRVSGSILRAAGLPELVTHTNQGYLELIVALATDAARRQALRARLEAVRLTAPLFDADRFVRALERAFHTMHERRLRGLPPAAFDVPDAVAAEQKWEPAPHRAASPEGADLRTVRALVAEGLELQKRAVTAEAADRYLRALALDPDCFDALQLLGVLRFRGGDLESGIALLMRATALQPDHPPTLNNLGNALRAAGRLDEAIQAYTRASDAPDPPAMVLHNLGLSLAERGDLEAAYAAYNRAATIEPDLQPARAARARLGQELLAWEHVQDDARFLAAARPPTGEEAVDPGSLLTGLLAADALRRYADAFATHLESKAARIDWPLEARGNRPLRVAYLSADFREHAVGYLVAPVFEAHDRRRVESFGYAWGGAEADATRTRIASGLDHFRDVSSLGDADLRARLRDDQIDIAVDLMGYTTRARPSLFAARIAPLQVGWLGYPGTLGGQLLDYIIADGFIIPEGSEPHYSEKVVRLPDTYLPYSQARPVALPRPRGEYGLPETAVVLVSFGPLRKITPGIFAVWMDVLDSTPDAVLWLGNGVPPAVANLGAALHARGIPPQRAILAQPLKDNADHLARYQVADLALDTHPYGSHSTAADALWGGCPFIALAGETFASRVSGSVLRAGGLPELITQSLEEYRSKIVELVQDTQRRRGLRARLEQLKRNSSLFDLERFVRSLERAYEGIAAQRARGAAPESMSVSGDA